MFFITVGRKAKPVRKNISTRGPLTADPSASLGMTKARVVPPLGV